MKRFFSILLPGLFLASAAFGDDATTQCMASCQSSSSDEASYTSCVANQCLTAYSGANGIAGSSTATASSTILAPSNPSAVVAAVVSQTYDPTTGQTTLVLSKDGSAAISAQIDTARANNKADLQSATDAIAALDNVIQTDENLKGQAAASGPVQVFGTNVNATGTQSNNDFQGQVQQSEADAGSLKDSATKAADNTKRACNALNLLQGKAQTDNCI